MVKYVGKEVRINRENTVRGLAKKAGIAPSTISKWENGSALPDFGTLDSVACALNVNPWELIKFER